jgi:lysophospholipase
VGTSACVTLKSIRAMVDIQTPGFPKLAAKLLAKGAALFHALKCYVPGEQHDWDAKQDAKDTAEKLTSDPARAGILPALYEARPELKMGGTTFGWILNTFKSIKILNDENYLKSIKTPVLMTIPGDERVVERSAEIRASELIPNVTRVEIPGAKHDVWREADKYRNIWLANVDKFLAQVLSLKNNPAPQKPQNKPAF